MSNEDLSHLLEYVDQLVVVPRICEVCLAHPAVFLYRPFVDWSRRTPDDGYLNVWPDTYVCRLCLPDYLAQRELKQDDQA